MVTPRESTSLKPDWAEFQCPGSKFSRIVNHVHNSFALGLPIPLGLYTLLALCLYMVTSNNNNPFHRSSLTFMLQILLYQSLSSNLKMPTKGSTHWDWSSTYLTDSGSEHRSFKELSRKKKTQKGVVLVHDQCIVIQFEGKEWVQWGLDKGRVLNNWDRSESKVFHVMCMCMLYLRGIGKRNANELWTRFTIRGNFEPGHWNSAQSGFKLVDSRGVIAR